MGDYCENCAREYGFELDYEASPCKGCGRRTYREEKD
jgi:hypothetical protein